MTDYSENDLKRIGERWLEKIRQAERREKDWMDDAEKAENIYTAGACNPEGYGEVPSFNILHSNVETIVPSIFNSSPSPEIRPRHLRDDPVGKVVSDILERSISTQVDDSALDQEVEGTAQDSFMAGRGITRIKFDADEVPAQMAIAQVLDPETGEMVEQEIEVEPARLEGERVIYENVSWRDFRMGPAKRWRDVPWVCFRHEVSEEEKERLEDPELAAKQKRDERAVDEDQDCTVWEIWDKESQRVFFVTEDNGKVLQIADDPLGLTGFFPCPQPVTPIKPTGKMTPVCPYAIYEKLAEELDTATKRITAIMKGLKVRGAIAGDAEVVELIGQAGDNELIPVPNIENLVAAGGLDKAIMWWPIETAIAVLQQLYLQREQTKQAIYEITGISDIIRGQGAASETATAQQIKTEWGALRVKKMQRLIERHVRDLFVLSAEVISRHFSYDALAKASGMQEVGDPQVQQLLSKPLDHYRIDVESDSTVKADLTKGRQEMAQFLEGTASFFSTMAPVVEQAPQSAGPLAKMYAAFARQFNLGKAAEDALEEFTTMAEQAAQGAGQQQDPETQAKMAEMQLEQQKAQTDAQLRQSELQMKMQEAQSKLQLEVEKLKLQAQNLGLDAELKRADLALKQQQLNLEEAKAEVDAAGMMAEIEIEQEQKRAAEIDD